MLSWTTSLDRETWAACGDEVVEFSWLYREIVAPARRADAPRTSLANPAQAWLSRVAAADRLAVVGVPLRDVNDPITLHGYVLEPALRSGTFVAIESEQRLTRLAPERFVDPGFEYPYTLERAIAVATSLHHGASVPTPEATERPVPTVAVALDPERPLPADLRNHAPSARRRTTISSAASRCEACAVTSSAEP
jgi:hypothetical protein